MLTNINSWDLATTHALLIDSWANLSCQIEALTNIIIPNEEAILSLLCVTGATLFQTWYNSYSVGPWRRTFLVHLSLTKKIVWMKLNKQMII